MMGALAEPFLYQMSLVKRKKNEHGANDPAGDRVLLVSSKRGWNRKPLSSVSGDTDGYNRLELAERAGKAAFVLMGQRLVSHFFFSPHVPLTHGDRSAHGGC